MSDFFVLCCGDSVPYCKRETGFFTSALGMRAPSLFGVLPGSGAATGERFLLLCWRGQDSEQEKSLSSVTCQLASLSVGDCEEGFGRPGDV